MARLGDICEILNGFAFKSEQYVDSGIRIIRIANVQKGYIEDNSPVYYPAKSSEAQKYALYNDDLLMSLTGNVGRVALLEEKYLPAALNQRVACLRIKDGIQLSKKFLYHFLNSDYFEEMCIASSKGVAQKNMSTEWLKEYNIPLPSVEKQSQVVNTLDKLDILIFLRKQQLAKLDELVRARFVEMFGDIEGTVPLSHYILALSAGKSLAGEEECVNKVLKTGAATYDEFDPSQVKNLPTDYTPQADHLLRTGDVIISRMNTAELVGAAAYVWEAPTNTYLPDRLWRAELKNNVCPIFVWQSLIQTTTKESIRKIASGTSGSMKNISKPGLLGIHVKKVEFDIQQEFSNFVEQVHRQKLTMQQSLDKLEVLRKSLMQEYFG